MIVDEIRLANGEWANDLNKVTQVQLIYNLLIVRLLCYTGTHLELDYMDVILVNVHMCQHFEIQSLQLDEIRISIIQEQPKSNVLMV